MFTIKLRLLTACHKYYAGLRLLPKAYAYDRHLPFAISILMSSSSLRSGSCLCKSIKYEVIGDPITFRICHCMNCKKATGSAFMSNLFFSKEVSYILSNTESIIESAVETRNSECCKERNTSNFIGTMIPTVAPPLTDTSVSIVALTCSFNQINNQGML